VVAKVSLNDVQVARVFWDGKGAQVVEKYTTKNGERETRYALFFDQPHGLTEGSLISVEGLLSATVDEFTKRDGSTGHAVNLKLNSPRVSNVQAPEKVGHAAVNQVWPDVAGTGQVEPSDGAPF
jgi:hypothetical protein